MTKLMLAYTNQVLRAMGRQLYELSKLTSSGNRKAELERLSNLVLECATLFE